MREGEEVGGLIANDGILSFPDWPKEYGFSLAYQ